jgi:hypothetical protein
LSVEAFVESAQAILKAGGLKTDFLNGNDMAMYRCETLDRHLEVIARPTRWTISYVHVGSRKGVRLKGDDVKGLEKALKPLCAESAFEPASGDPTFGKFR